MDQKKIGAFLRELRKEKRLTQERLSESLGVTNRSVSRWENGVNLPELDLIIELARFYEVSIEEILDGERKNEMVDKKTEQILLKAADYESNEKQSFSKRMCRLFVAALLSYVIYCALNFNGLDAKGDYEMLASASLGVVGGALFVGVLYTSGRLARVKAFKRRMLHKIGKAGCSAPKDEG